MDCSRKFVLLSVFLLYAPWPTVSSNDVASSEGAYWFYPDQPDVECLGIDEGQPGSNFEGEIDIYRALYTTEVWPMDKMVVVEAYAHWCGICQSLMPQFARLAESWREGRWSYLVELAAIDCAADGYMKMCSNIFPSHNTPRAYLFNATSRADKTIKPREITPGFTSIRASLAVIAAPIIGSKLTLLLDLKHVFQFVDTVAKNKPDDELFLLRPTDKSKDFSRFAALELFLDVPKNVQVGVLKLEGEDLANLLSMLKIPQEKKDRSFAIHVSREKLTANRRIAASTVIPIRDDVTISADYTRAWIFQRLYGAENVPNWVKPDAERAKLAEKVAVALADVKRPHIYDLEMAIQHAMSEEIMGALRTQDGPLLAQSERAMAIIKSLNVFYRALPDSESKEKINAFHSFLVLKFKEGQDISVDEFEENIPQLTTPSHHYVTCRGSSPRYRGFPCGMWTVFHTAAVNSIAQQNPGQVFYNFVEYIDFFFQCEDCANHFLEASEEYNAGQYGYKDTLWISMTLHNKANLRLSGAANEDPAFPKRQWPTPELCPDCYARGPDLLKNPSVEFLQVYYTIDTDPIGEENGEDKETNKDEL